MNERTNKQTLFIVSLCKSYVFFFAWIKMCLLVKVHINDALNFFGMFICSLKLNNHPQSYGLICTISTLLLTRIPIFDGFVFVRWMFGVFAFFIKVDFCGRKPSSLSPAMMAGWEIKKETYKIRNETYFFQLLIKWSSHLDKLQKSEREKRNIHCTLCAVVMKHLMS